MNFTDNFRKWWTSNYNCQSSNSNIKIQSAYSRLQRKCYRCCYCLFDWILGNCLIISRRNRTQRHMFINGQQGLSSSCTRALLFHKYSHLLEIFVPESDWKWSVGTGASSQEKEFFNLLRFFVVLSFKLWKQSRTKWVPATKCI